MRFIAAFFAVVIVACSSSTDQADIIGKWGSQQASLVLQRSGGTVSYQCGAGTVDSAWTLSASGQWTATGQHYYGGGPVPVGGRQPHPARYAGQLDGAQLEFTVTVTDLAQVLGPFYLTRNGPTVSEVCL